MGEGEVHEGVKGERKIYIDACIACCMHNYFKAVFYTEIVSVVTHVGDF